jgi:hypothetical protein
MHSRHLQYNMENLSLGLEPWTISLIVVTKGGDVTTGCSVNVREGSTGIEQFPRVLIPPHNGKSKYVS